VEQVIYDKLQSVAHARHLTNYSEMGKLVGLAPHDYRLWVMLDEINQYEHLHNRPMISALVISQEENRPGSGFWACASGLGKYIEGSDKDRFWSEELGRVWDYWASH
jgi:hypothetical protein